MTQLDSAMEIERDIYKRQERTRASEEMVRRCRQVIAEYLPPDSGISSTETLNRIIEILDEPDGEQFVRLKAPGKTAPKKQKSPGLP